MRHFRNSTTSADIFRITSPVARILIFSLITDQRDAAAVFERLATSLAGNGIQYAIFTTYERDQESESKNSMHIHLASLESPLLTQVQIHSPNSWRHRLKTNKFMRQSGEELNLIRAFHLSRLFKEL